MDLNNVRHPLNYNPYMYLLNPMYLQRQQHQQPPPNQAAQSLDADGRDRLNTDGPQRVPGASADTAQSNSTLSNCPPDQRRRNFSQNPQLMVGHGMQVPLNGSLVQNQQRQQSQSQTLSGLEGNAHNQQNEESSDGVLDTSAIIMQANTTLLNFAPDQMLGNVGQNTHLTNAGRREHLNPSQLPNDELQQPPAQTLPGPDKDRRKGTTKEGADAVPDTYIVQANSAPSNNLPHQIIGNFSQNPSLIMGDRLQAPLNSTQLPNWHVQELPKYIPSSSEVHKRNEPRREVSHGVQNTQAASTQADPTRLNFPADRMLRGFGQNPHPMNARMQASLIGSQQHGQILGSTFPLLPFAYPGLNPAMRPIGCAHDATCPIREQPSQHPVVFSSRNQHILNSSLPRVAGALPAAQALNHRPRHNVTLPQAPWFPGFMNHLIMGNSAPNYFLNQRPETATLPLPAPLPARQTDREKKTASAASNSSSTSRYRSIRPKNDTQMSTFRVPDVSLVAPNTTYPIVLQHQVPSERTENLTSNVQAAPINRTADLDRAHQTTNAQHGENSIHLNRTAPREKCVEQLTQSMSRRLEIQNPICLRENQLVASHGEDPISSLPATLNDYQNGKQNGLMSESISMSQLGNKYHNNLETPVSDYIDINEMPQDLTIKSNCMTDAQPRQNTNANQSCSGEKSKAKVLKDKYSENVVKDKKRTDDFSLKKQKKSSSNGVPPEKNFPNQISESKAIILSANSAVDNINVGLLSNANLHKSGDNKREKINQPLDLSHRLSSSDTSQPLLPHYPDTYTNTTRSDICNLENRAGNSNQSVATPVSTVKRRESKLSAQGNWQAKRQTQGAVVGKADTDEVIDNTRNKNVSFDLGKHARNHIKDTNNMFALESQNVIHNTKPDSLECSERPFQAEQDKQQKSDEYSKEVLSNEKSMMISDTHSKSNDVVLPGLAHNDIKVNSSYSAKRLQGMKSTEQTAAFALVDLAQSGTQAQLEPENLSHVPRILSESTHKPRTENLSGTDICMPGPEAQYLKENTSGDMDILQDLPPLQHTSPATASDYRRRRELLRDSPTRICPQSKPFPHAEKDISYYYKKQEIQNVSSASIIISESDSTEENKVEEGSERHQTRDKFLPEAEEKSVSQSMTCHTYSDVTAPHHSCRDVASVPSISEAAAAYPRSRVHDSSVGSESDTSLNHGRNGSEISGNHQTRFQSKPSESGLSMFNPGTSVVNGLDEANATCKDIDYTLPRKNFADVPESVHNLLTQICLNLRRQNMSHDSPGRTLKRRKIDGGSDYCDEIQKTGLSDQCVEAKTMNKNLNERPNVADPITVGAPIKKLSPGPVRRPQEFSPVVSLSNKSLTDGDEQFCLAKESISTETQNTDNFKEITGTSASYHWHESTEPLNRWCERENNLNNKRPRTALLQSADESQSGETFPVYRVSETELNNKKVQPSDGLSKTAMESDIGKTLRNQPALVDQNNISNDKNKQNTVTSGEQDEAICQRSDSSNLPGNSNRSLLYMENQNKPLEDSLKYIPQIDTNKQDNRQANQGLEEAIYLSKQNSSLNMKIQNIDRENWNFDSRNSFSESNAVDFSAQQNGSPLLDLSNHVSIATNHLHDDDCLKPAHNASNKKAGSLHMANSSKDKERILDIAEIKENITTKSNCFSTGIEKRSGKGEIVENQSPEQPASKNLTEDTEQLKPDLMYHFDSHLHVYLTPEVLERYDFDFIKRFFTPKKSDEQNEMSSPEEVTVYAGSKDFKQTTCNKTLYKDVLQENNQNTGGDRASPPSTTQESTKSRSIRSGPAERQGSGLSQSTTRSSEACTHSDNDPVIISNTNDVAHVQSKDAVPDSSTSPTDKLKPSPADSQERQTSHSNAHIPRWSMNEDKAVEPSGSETHRQTKDYQCSSRYRLHVLRNKRSHKNKHTTSPHEQDFNSASKDPTAKPNTAQNAFNTPDEKTTLPKKRNLDHLPEMNAERTQVLTHAAWQNGQDFHYLENQRPDNASKACMNFQQREAATSSRSLRNHEDSRGPPQLPRVAPGDDVFSSSSSDEDKAVQVTCSPRYQLPALFVTPQMTEHSDEHDSDPALGSNATNRDYEPQPLSHHEQLESTAHSPRGLARSHRPGVGGRNIHNPGYATTPGTGQSHSIPDGSAFVQFYGEAYSGDSGEDSPRRLVIKESCSEQESESEGDKAGEAATAYHTHSFFALRRQQRMTWPSTF